MKDALLEVLGAPDLDASRRLGRASATPAVDVAALAGLVRSLPRGRAARVTLGAEVLRIR